MLARAATFAEMTAMPMAHSTRDKKPPTIFVVDPDAAVRDAISITLRANGFRVRLFGSGGEFLDRRPLVPRGCLLVEFDLLDMAGTELISRLAAARIVLPTVIMSARLRLPPGIAASLQKPFGQDELLRCLRDVKVPSI